MIPTLDQIFRKIEGGKTAVRIKDACSNVGVNTSVYAHAREKYRKGMCFNELTRGEQDVLLELLRMIRKREEALSAELTRLVL